MWHEPCVAARVRFWLGSILVLVSRLAQAEAGSELPIQFREGLLWMEVNIPQSKEPLHFLVDSGASASVVNRDTARRLGLKLGPKVDVTAVGTTMTGHWPVKMTARAGQVELPD